MTVQDSSGLLRSLIGSKDSSSINQEKEQILYDATNYRVGFMNLIQRHIERWFGTWQLLVKSQKLSVNLICVVCQGSNTSNFPIWYKKGWENYSWCDCLKVRWLRFNISPWIIVLKQIEEFTQLLSGSPAMAPSKIKKISSSLISFIKLLYHNICPSRWYPRALDSNSKIEPTFSQTKILPTQILLKVTKNHDQRITKQKGRGRSLKHHVK